MYNDYINHNDGRTIMSLLIKETDHVLFKSRGDNTEVFILLETDGFKVLWGDYVANAWEEKYVSLGTALARAAVLVHASEHNDNFGFKQSSDEEFAKTWDQAMDAFVFYEI
jgi:hypothetical protein